MKNRSLVLVILCLTLSGVNAQKHQGKRFNDCPNNGSKNCLIDDLSTEQKEKLKAEKVKFMGETQDEKNKLGELKAKIRTLSTSEPIDQKQIKKTLEEMNSIHASLEKKRIRHQQTMKSFLSDEQVILFESKAQRRSKGEYARQKKGMRHGQRHQGQMGQGHKRKHHGGQGKMQQQNKSMMSDELKEQMKASHLAMKKSMQPLENKLAELNAQLKSQTTGKNIDLKKIDNIIDQKASVRLEMAQIKSDMMLDMRGQLTDEQKIWFDSRHRKHRARMN
jgi:Spy/CpxP family protein refolding chaperone